MAQPNPRHALTRFSLFRQKFAHLCCRNLFVKAIESDEELPGGVYEVRGAENDSETIKHARFALDEHNKKSNAGLEFSRLVKVKHQVVEGSMHYLTIEALDASKKKLILEAKVWDRPWLNSKILHEINYVGDSTSTYDQW